MSLYKTLPVAGIAALGITFGVVASTSPALSETAHAEELTQAQATLAPRAADAPVTVVSQPAPLIQNASAPAPVTAVSVETGPSRWEGKRLRHPSGGSFPKSVTRWANIVVAVMDEHKIARKHLPGILAQIQQESNGNPDSVNRYDSNAAAGTPSKGLLQVIAPTYQTHAKKGFGNLKYQTVPYTNIWSALHYVKKSYGMNKFNSWSNGANHAY